MTKNQIDYWKLQEDKRNNLQNNQETYRHNKATEDLGNRNYAETRRHNITTERETGRTNLANEAIRSAGVQLQSQTLAETARHNRATESNQLIQLGETARSNKANEAIRRQSNSIASFNAKENQRHNVRSENLGYSQMYLKTASDILKSGISLAALA